MMRKVSIGDPQYISVELFERTEGWMYQWNIALTCYQTGRVSKDTYEDPETAFGEACAEMEGSIRNQLDDMDFGFNEPDQELVVKFFEV